MPGIAFSSRQNDKMTPEALYSSAKSLMPLAESHCQAAKRPNRRFVNARFLWVECITTLEESHFQGNKMPNRGSINTMGGWSHAP
jgi:hypothetical protein